MSFGIAKETGEMTGARVLIAAHTFEGGMVYPYYLGAGRTATRNESFEDVSNVAAYKQGLVITVTARFKTHLADNAMIFVAARGPVTGNGEPGFHDEDRIAGRLTASSVRIVGDRDAVMRSAHAWLMGIAWSVILPIGTFWPRFGKRIGDWFRLHISFQLFGTFFVALAFYFGIHVGSGRQLAHYALGVIAMACACSAFLLGLARPGKEHRFREKWALLHFWSARVGFFFAFINIWIGISIITDDKKTYNILYGVTVGVILLVFGILSIVKKRSSSYKVFDNQGGSSQTFSNPNFSAEGGDEEPEDLQGGMAAQYAPAMTDDDEEQHDFVAASVTAARPIPAPRSAPPAGSSNMFSDVDDDEDDRIN